MEKIRISKEAYLFLQEELHRQRSASNKPLSDQTIKRLNYGFDNAMDKEGFKEYRDGDLGGCKNNRWTSWSVADVKAMLDAEGLEYKEG